MCALLAVAVVLYGARTGVRTAAGDPLAVPAAKPAKVVAEKPQPKKTAAEKPRPTKLSGEKSLPKITAPAKELRTAEEAIEQALKSPTQMDFIETPLQDVIDYLKDYHHIEIQLDKVAMDDAGVGTDTPVTKNLKGISLRSALKLILHQLNLTYTIQNEVLLITTPEAAESHLIRRVYDVADLVVYNDDEFGQVDDYTPLTDLITSTVEYRTWDCVGGAGSISGQSLGTAKILVVSQTYEVHGQIADLLKEIRAVAAKHSGEGVPRRQRSELKPQPHGGAAEQKSGAAKEPQGQGSGRDKKAEAGK
jgi:hypothetical protein